MKSIRNIAIIAHVDHGKTTLVDQILKQVRFFRANEEVRDCFLDSNDLERERGITILAKNISIHYNGVKMNIIDTPGHSDFGGQVERVLRLADGALLLVDSAEGPMPQTRFVLNKVLCMGLKPIVVINKVDKQDARCDEVLNHLFDLFCELKATDEQLDFQVLYASAKEGWVDTSLQGPRSSMQPLMEAILAHCPAPPRKDGPTQMQIVTIDYDNYMGRIGIGRVYRGILEVDQPLVLIKKHGVHQEVRIKRLLGFEGMAREDRDHVVCGDLCAVVGVDGIDIGDTLASQECPEALPAMDLDEPTVSMIFRVNDSPLYGKEGKYVTSRHLKERLFKDTQRDVALKMEELDSDTFQVSGRGVLHLSILIETMRREGYEMSVSPPHVITKRIDGRECEPMERLSVDTPLETMGGVIELVGYRRGEISRMDQHGQRMLLEFVIPTRGLFGIRAKLLAVTAGEAIVSHTYSHYQPKREDFSQRRNGALVSMDKGLSTAYAIDSLQQRGIFFVGPGEMCYEGMIVGENKVEGDMLVNIQKTKNLTNMRAAGADRALKLAPPVRLSLEEALEYVAEDERVEITPLSIRLRKNLLTENARRRIRSAALAAALSA